MFLIKYLIWNTNFYVSAEGYSPKNYTTKWTILFVNYHWNTSFNPFFLFYKLAEVILERDTIHCLTYLDEGALPPVLLIGLSIFTIIPISKNFFRRFSDISIESLLTSFQLANES